ncbi:MAG: hypothetical protein HOW97_21210 [Catenulispora sp.]|nr:hypothetical protein [Catenulispora sp.]
MEPDDIPPTDDSRLSDAGDVEVFDGETWRPVASLLADPQYAERDPEDSPPGEVVTDPGQLEQAFLRDGPGGPADLPSDR